MWAYAAIRRSKHHSAAAPVEKHDRLTRHSEPFAIDRSCLRSAGQQVDERKLVAASQKYLLRVSSSAHRQRQQQRNQQDSMTSHRQKRDGD